MKRLLLKIFAMMGCAMLLVFAISRTALFVMEQDGNIRPHVMYYISIVSGLMGLLLFALLLNIFVFSRLKKLSTGFGEVAKGNYDVTLQEHGKDEISQLNRDFNSMAHALNSSDYLSREFVRNVSHEFKTPLSSIIGFSKLLRTGELTTVESSEYADIIIKEAERLTLISKNMLAISKIDSDAIIVKEDVFDLAELIRSIVLSMQTTWQAKELELDIRLDECVVKSSEELLYHVFQNLISNAIKFVNHRGKVNILLHRLGGTVIFRINNTGEQITAIDRDKIFNQFYSSKSKNAGSGLGLPLANKIVKALGGTIALNDCTDTEFVITLPL